MQLETDILIFGGGIAGLWTLQRLIQQGYSAVLLESGNLGGVQTIVSQGIIHGGVKYALTGSFNASAQAVGEMPGRWRACLDGKGEVDLQQVKCLADHQYLWSTEGLFSQLSGFFASKLMRSRMQAVAPADGPGLFQNAAFKGELYRLEEPVLDVPSLVEALVNRLEGCCYRLERDDWAPLPGGEGIRVGDRLELRAKRLVLAAGAGNRDILGRFGHPQPAMQLRPLHMSMVRGNLPPLYAHCLGASANPRLTITSHQDSAGRTIWYIGGAPAEQGVEGSLEELVAHVRQELTAVLPWLDMGDVEWAGVRVDRAELAQPNGKRPSSYHVGQNGSLITIWPTKLVFAPQVADEVLAFLQRDGVQPSAEQELSLPLPQAEQTRPAWESVSEWI